MSEREQARTSFDTLYTLAKKMEVCQPTCSHRGGKGLLMPIRTSEGDTPPPQDGLQH